jgi:hypothetical protein
MNGREWLARGIDDAGIRYLRQDNCFPRIADGPRAQRLMDPHLHLPRHLDRLASLLNPVHGRVFRGHGLQYYRSIHQTEWASAVRFNAPASLAFICPGVLGQEASDRFAGKLASGSKRRPEGVRAKHRVKANSAKICDKAAIILRTETTINDASALKVLRTRERDSNGNPESLPMRKSAPDIRRRAEVGTATNERYFEALAPVHTNQSVGHNLQGTPQRRNWKGQIVRAQGPSAAQDQGLFCLFASGEPALSGIRNRDILAAIHPRPPAKGETPPSGTLHPSSQDATCSPTDSDDPPLASPPNNTPGTAIRKTAVMLHGTTHSHSKRPHEMLPPYEHPGRHRHTADPTQSSA